MATLQEIIAKRQSMGPNATNVEARQALMATPAVTPAPTTPIVPTPVPTQAPVMDQMAGKTVAERQAIRSGQPAPVTTTPPPTTQTTPQVETPAPVTTPVQPAPVEPVKAPVKPVTPTKTEAPIDYNQAQGREQEITNNVQNFLKSGMNPDQVKQASGYNEATPEKKAIIDGIISGASQGALMNEKDALNALISGVSVPKQNTQAFRNAEFKANTFRKFNSMTPTQLLDNLKMGEIGTEMDQLLSQNPNYAQAKAKYSEIQKINNINNAIGNIANGIKGNQIPTKTAQQQEEDISNALMRKWGMDDANAQAFSEFIATDEEMADNKAKLLTNKEQLAGVNRQIADTTKLINDGIKELKAKKGDLPASALVTLLNSTFQEVNNTLTNLNTTKDLLNADIKMEMDIAKSAYDAKSADIQAQNAIKSQMALNEYKAEFDKKQAQEALKDPATQIKATMDEFAKLGIVAQGDLTSKIAEFQKSGKTLPEYITGLRQQFMSKPEYQQMLAKNKGAGISYQTIGNKVYKIGADGSITETNISTGADESKWGVIGKNADGSDKYGFINTATSTVTPYLSPTGEATGDLRYLASQYPGQAWAKNNNPAGITWNSNFDKGTGTAKLFTDAGIKFEKGTARPANEGGNYVTFATIEDGLKAQQILMTQTYGNSTVGQMLSSWVGTSEGPNYAKQVAGMAGITDLNQKVSALSPEQVSKLQMAKIQKESPGLSKLLTQPTTTPKNTNQYTDQNVNDLAYLTELQEKNPTQAAKEMKDLGYSARDIANYKAGNVPLTEKQKTSSINLANSIKDLLTNYDYTDATGFHFFDEAPSGSDWASAEEKIKTIVANLTLPSLGMLKGPMSDKDLAFIQAASSNLSTKQNDEVFGKQLIDAYNLAARRAGIPEVTSLDEIKKATGQPQAIQTNTGVTNTGGGQTQEYKGYVIKPF